jgi:predicted aspartyl protease
MILVLTAAAALTAISTPQQPVERQSAAGPSVTRLETTLAPSSTAPGAGGDTLDLAALPDNRLTVAVAVGAQGPFRFLVDTAADRSAVSHQLAARLGLRPAGTAKLHSVAGLSRVQTTAVKGMRIASRALPEVTAPLLDAVHVGADGILGTDVLRSSMVHFDFKGRQLLIAPAARREWSRRGDSNTIVVEARRRAGRLIVTDAELDGQWLTVVLDTGSEVSVGNDALRRALERRRALAVPGEPLTLHSVTGAKLPASYMLARRLELGGVTLTGLGIAFADVHTFRAMGIDKRPALLLGMNALEAFESLTIDMAEKKLRFVMPAGSGGGRFAAVR